MNLRSPGSQSVLCYTGSCRATSVGSTARGHQLTKTAPRIEPSFLSTPLGFSMLVLLNGGVTKLHSRTLNFQQALLLNVFEKGFIIPLSLESVPTSEVFLRFQQQTPALQKHDGQLPSLPNCMTRITKSSYSRLISTPSNWTNMPSVSLSSLRHICNSHGCNDVQNSHQTFMRATSI